MTGRARRQQRKRARAAAKRGLFVVVQPFGYGAFSIDVSRPRPLFAWQTDFGRNFATPIAGAFVRNAWV